MSQERNQHALQRLMKYIAPRLYENEPDSEQSERALRALSGQLGSNPPYMIDAFQLTEDLSDWIEDVAISPSGQVAILLGRKGDTAKTKNMYLTNWPRPRGYSELVNLGCVSEDTDVRILFPEGSQEPAVIMGGEKVVWRNWTVELPWKDELGEPEGAYLTLWEDADHFHHAAYLRDGVLCYKMKVVGAYSKPHAKNVRWLGLIDGSLAWITTDADPYVPCETLHCRHVEGTTLTGEQIIPESIGVVDGEIQFLTRYPGGMRAYRLSMADHKKRRGSDLMGDCWWGDGRFFGYNSRVDTGSIYMFNKRRHWESVAELAKGQMAIKEGSYVFDFGDHVTIVEPPESRMHRVIDVRLEERVVEMMPIVGMPRMGFCRAHHGLMYQTLITREHGFIWNDFGATSAKRPPTRTFPLYNRFDTLTSIQDTRGKAIMSWGYAEGTFAIVRYPLPIR